MDTQHPDIKYTKDYRSDEHAQTDPSYWRLYYEIQGSLTKENCGHPTNVAHRIAKKLFKKWTEKE